MPRLFILCALCLLAAVVPAAESDHGHAHGDHGHQGAAHDLGKVVIAGTTFAVILHGEIEAGGEAVLGIEVADGPTPSELRVWVGVQNARGSVKALLPVDDHGHYHGHLEVPATLPASSAIWIEVATDAARERGSLSLPAADHAHAEGGAGQHGGGPAKKADEDHDHGAHAGHDH